MLKKIGFNSVISSSVEEIENAKKLILPGVGAFDSGMEKLHSLNLIPILNKKVLEEKVPILGVCLGMQLMTKRSEEGKMQGLEWVDAETLRFNFPKEEKNLKIPNMGWKNIQVKKNERLLAGIENPRFYFVHSYYVKCDNDEDVLSTSSYSIEFVSAFSHQNILGVQFHPEKSHKYGMKLLQNFMEL